jgi:protein O-GlcNAc transferase
MSNWSVEQLLDRAGRHVNTNEFAAAGVLVAQVLKLEPSNVRALCFQAIVAAETGQQDVALATIERALEVAPRATGVINNAACIFFQCGRPARAMEMWQRLAQTTPPSAEVFYNLALCHMRLGNLESAETSFRKVIQLAPSHRAAYANLGNLVKSAGRIEEAIAIFREGLRRHPGDLPVHSNLLYAMHFDPAFGPEDIVREARAWGKSFEAAIPAQTQYANDRSPGRRLRIGYISANFRDHSETYFVLPLFRAIDRAAFETYVYSCNVADDQVTPLLRQHADAWRDAAALNDQQLAAAITQDRIDVLVDLTMHMEGGRPGVFARKPAPVQVAWLAYPSTTGLERLDYTILDPYLDRDATHFSETACVLPASYWCYEVYGPCPDVSSLPALAKRGVTFGSLNNFSKVNRQTLDAWAQILRGIGGSRLQLYVDSKGTAEGVRRLLAEKGIDPQRLVFQFRVGREAYLRSYQSIDIALDPFPYNGATTTFDALWMGVPVVSRAGTTAVSRAGLSILSNLGHAEWVAQTWDEYIAIAQGLAGDLPRLREIRQSLRGRLEKSILMDSKAFAGEMGKAYRTMWRKWCDRT